MLDVYRRKGYIRFNIIGNGDGYDVEMTKRLLKTKISIFMIFLFYGYSEHEDCDILLDPKLSFITFRNGCFG